MVPIKFWVRCRETGPVTGAVPPRRQEVGPWSQFNPRSSTGSPGRLPEQFRLAGTRWDRGPSYIPSAVSAVRAGLPERFCLADRRWDRGPSSISDAAPAVRAGYRSSSASQARGGTMVPVQFRVQCRKSGPVTGAVPPRRHEVGPWSQLYP